MSTDIRPEVSKHNKYYISKERYYELKHFCLQYPEWAAKYRAISEEMSLAGFDPTGKKAVDRVHLETKMKLVKDTAFDADSGIGNYIFESVTQGKTYTFFLMMRDVPCGRDMFYDRYRKFFYILDRKMQ